MTDLPPYPASFGPLAARKATAARTKYAAALAELDKELAATEEAFAEAFDRASRSVETRDRIEQLSKKTRRI